MGLTVEDATYIDAVSEEVKAKALALISSQQDIYFQHHGLNPANIFGIDKCKEIGDTRLLQLIADCYDENKETLSGRILRSTVYMKDSILRTILSILTYPFSIFTTNATKQKGLKLLLKPVSND